MMKPGFYSTLRQVIRKNLFNKPWNRVISGIAFFNFHKFRHQYCTGFTCNFEFKQPGEDVLMREFMNGVVFNRPQFKLPLIEK